MFTSSSNALIATKTTPPPVRAAVAVLPLHPREAGAYPRTGVAPYANAEALATRALCLSMNNT